MSNLLFLDVLVHGIDGLCALHCQHVGLCRIGGHLVLKIKKKISLKLFYFSAA